MAVGEVLRSNRGLLGLIALSRPSRAPWSGDNASATLHMREAEPSSPDALNCITRTQDLSTRLRLPRMVTIPRASTALDSAVLRKHLDYA